MAANATASAALPSGPGGPGAAAATAATTAAAGRARTGPSNANIAASWRELTATNGRKYYYNMVTKVSMWEMPPDYAEHLERTKDVTTIDRETAQELFTKLLRDKVRRGKKRA